MAPDRLLELLVGLYGAEIGAQTRARLEGLLAGWQPPARPPARPLDQRDAMLITYADQFLRAGEAPLQTLAGFARRRLRGAVSAIHLLPFYPSSSDDGFSVIDYRQVDPQLGGWEDIAGLGRDFLLMFDAVINHASAGSQWFEAYLQGRAPFNEYFLAVPPDSDLSQVVRPRALPLLTPFDAADGRRWLWTTFSADQVDLNYRSPDLLLAILAILLEYAARGARFLRLDAIAYLWKEAGTRCIHLPQTHLVIQLIRAVFEQTAPYVVLITETNVAHAENISYFGDGFNEAGMVYNFALPPLVMHALAQGDAARLSEWAAGLRLPSAQTAFFNFLASHDGIGLNPARGILNEAEVEGLMQRALDHGGLVSYKNNPDGSQSGYELNISYFDALSDPGAGEPLELQARRFLAAQAVLLSLAGLPGIYVHSLFGSRSWPAGVRATGRSRTINRQKFDLAELEAGLDGPGLRRLVFAGYRRLLAARASSPAFHPYGSQQVLAAGRPVLALLRSGPGEQQARALCLVNLSGQETTARVRLPGGSPAGPWRDLLTGARVDLTAASTLQLEGYQAAWLVPEGESKHA